MIDSHAHIYLDDFRDDLDQMIKRAKDAGVTKVLMPNIDKDSIDAMLEVEQKFSLDPQTTPLEKLYQRLQEAGFARAGAVEMVDWYFDAELYEEGNIEVDIESPFYENFNFSFNITGVT